MALQNAQESQLTQDPVSVDVVLEDVLDLLDSHNFELFVGAGPWTILLLEFNRAFFGAGAATLLVSKIPAFALPDPLLLLPPPPEYDEIRATSAGRLYLILLYCSLVGWRLSPDECVVFDEVGKLAEDGLLEVAPTRRL